VLISPPRALDDDSDRTIIVGQSEHGAPGRTVHVPDGTEVRAHWRTDEARLNPLNEAAISREHA
jgi:hypothetical protein